MMIEMCVPNSMRATEHRDTEKKQHGFSGKLLYSQRSMITIMGLSQCGSKKEKMSPQVQATTTLATRSTMTIIKKAKIRKYYKQSRQD